MIRAKSITDKLEDPSPFPTSSVDPPGDVTVTATLAASPSSSLNKASSSRQRYERSRSGKQEAAEPIYLPLSLLVWVRISLKLASRMAIAALRTLAVDFSIACAMSALEVRRA